MHGQLAADQKYKSTMQSPRWLIRQPGPRRVIAGKLSVTNCSKTVSTVALVSSFTNLATMFKKE